MIGVPSGVIGRKPVQKVARRGRRRAETGRLTDISSVARGRSGWSVAPTLGGAADADAVAQAGDRDLVGFIHHRGLRRAVVVHDRQRDRIAFDRVDRKIDAERLSMHAANSCRARQRRRSAVSGAGDRWRADRCGRLRSMRSMVVSSRKPAPRPSAMPASAVVNLITIPGLVAGQSQSADELVSHGAERRFGRDAAGDIQHLERNPILSSTRCPRRSPPAGAAVRNSCSVPCCARRSGCRSSARSSIRLSRLYSASGPCGSCSGRSARWCNCAASGRSSATSRDRAAGRSDQRAVPVHGIHCTAFGGMPGPAQGEA